MIKKVSKKLNKLINKFCFIGSILLVIVWPFEIVISIITKDYAALRFNIIIEFIGILQLVFYVIREGKWRRTKKDK